MLNYYMTSPTLSPKTGVGLSYKERLELACLDRIQVALNKIRKQNEQSGSVHRERKAELVRELKELNNSDRTGLLV